MPYWIAPHLAFLVQWLRVLGLDVHLWAQRTIPGDKEETVIQWARFPLSLKGPDTKTVTLSSSTPQDLLKEFFHSAGFQPSPSDRFKRCLRCNSLLIPLSPEEARNKWPALPVYVFQTQKSFNWCDQCKQLFWAGTHVRNMIRTLEEWGIIAKGS
jgi:uncharacterized protein with PIN domain